MSETNPITKLQDRLSTFLETLEHINPEETSIEDIDRLIAMIDDIEEQIHKK